LNSLTETLCLDPSDCNRLTAVSIFPTSCCLHFILNPSRDCTPNDKVINTSVRELRLATKFSRIAKNRVTPYSRTLTLNDRAMLAAKRSIVQTMPSRTSAVRELRLATKFSRIAKNLFTPYSRKLTLYDRVMVAAKRSILQTMSSRTSVDRGLKFRNFLPRILKPRLHTRCPRKLTLFERLILDVDQKRAERRTMDKQEVRIGLTQARGIQSNAISLDPEAYPYSDPNPNTNTDHLDLGPETDDSPHSDPDPDPNTNMDPLHDPNPSLGKPATLATAMCSKCGKPFTSEQACHGHRRWCNTKSKTTANEVTKQALHGHHGPGCKSKTTANEVKYANKYKP
jgi:hypothetical protein